MRSIKHEDQASERPVVIAIPLGANTRAEGTSYTPGKYSRRASLGMIFFFADQY
jgi:hypothetical protein